MFRDEAAAAAARCAVATLLRRAGVPGDAGGRGRSRSRKGGAANKRRWPGEKRCCGRHVAARGSRSAGGTVVAPPGRAGGVVIGGCTFCAGRRKRVAAGEEVVDWVHIITCHVGQVAREG